MMQAAIQNQGHDHVARSCVFCSLSVTKTSQNKMDCTDKGLQICTDAQASGSQYVGLQPTAKGMPKTMSTVSHDVVSGFESGSQNLDQEGHCVDIGNIYVTFDRKSPDFMFSQRTFCVDYQNCLPQTGQKTMVCSTDSCQDQEYS